MTGWGEENQNNVGVLWGFFGVGVEGDAWGREEVVVSITQTVLELFSTNWARVCTIRYDETHHHPHSSDFPSE